MTPKKIASQAEGDLESELAPLAEEIEAGGDPAVEEPDVGLPPVTEELAEAPEAALPEDVEALPGVSAETQMQSDPDIDVEAAAHATAAASIDLTGLSDSEIAEVTMRAVEPGVPAEEIDPLLDLGGTVAAPMTEAQAVDISLIMSFGSPGVPVPEGFDPVDLCIDRGGLKPGLSAQNLDHPDGMKS